MLTVVMVLGEVDASSRSKSLNTLPEFYSHDVLDDGETERALYWRGVAVKETSAIISLNGTKEGATLRQVTKGHHLIQLIYDAYDSLTDCEYVSDRETVRSFVDTFRNEYHLLSNGTTQLRMKSLRLIRSADDVPVDMAAFIDYAALKLQCRKLHKRIRRNGAIQSGQGLANRHRRDVMMLVGTKWCGAGNRASSYNDLGADHGIDRCCRHHDHCPYVIKSKRTDYEHTNQLFITVSHCTCDERFRSCLKQANTAAANLVGKLFFNIIQTKCFVLKPEKMCKKTSWWGKCLKTELKKKAYIRNPIPY